MQQRWTERGIKGAKYLASGILLTFAKDLGITMAQGNHLMMGLVLFICGVVGPIFLVTGLYLVGTRHK